MKDIPNAIRSCDRQDLDAIASIEQTCFGAAGALSRIALTQYFELGGSAFAVAESSEKIIAFAIGAMATGSSMPVGWVLDVAVLPDFQTRGVARDLGAHVINRLVELGAQRIRATVSPANRRSLNLLTRIGFDVVDDVADYFGPGERRFIMERRGKE
jgi:ribosomal protein S18 acetylase RimI-like enzyme